MDPFSDKVLILGMCLCVSVIPANSWLHTSPLEFSLRPKFISVVVGLLLAAPVLVLRFLISCLVSALPHILLQKMESLQAWSIYQCPWVWGPRYSQSQCYPFLDNLPRGQISVLLMPLALFLNLWAITALSINKGINKLTKEETSIIWGRQGGGE